METLHLPTSTCPHCGCELVRRRRSLLDRLRSLFTPKARFVCSARCGWEALLPLPRRRPSAAHRQGMSYRHRPVLDAARGLSAGGRKPG